MNSFQHYDPPQAEQKRPKSRAELAAAAEDARAAALAQPLHEAAPHSKGLKMMQRMGFQAGDVLGKKAEGDEPSEARAEPVGVEMKCDKGGIGLDSERKRKIREEWEGERKRAKAEEGEFRERVRKEREDRRAEGLLIAAQKVAEEFDEEQERDGDGGGISTRETDDDEDGDGDGGEEHDDGEHEDGDKEGKTQRKRSTKRLKDANVLWRGLVRHRDEKERERRRRYDLIQSLSRKPAYDDPEEDEDDRRANDGNSKADVLEEELEEDDAELDEFQALEPVERLSRIVLFLRERWRYCFWCKFRYDDETMEGCPGVTEEDHD